MNSISNLTEQLREFRSKLLMICGVGICVATIIQNIVVFIMREYSPMTESATEYLVIGIGVILLLKLQKPILAKWFLVISVGILITHFNIQYGKNGGVDFGTFTIIVLAAVLFPKTKERIIIVMLALSLFSTSQIYLSLYGPSEPLPTVNSGYYIQFFAITIMLALVVRLYKRLILSQKQDLNALTDKIVDKKEAITSQNDDLTSINAELEKFIYVAAHDIKTPLRNINSFIDLEIRNKRKGDPSYNEEFLKIAKENSMHLFQLVTDILDYSKLQQKGEPNGIISKALLSRLQKSVKIKAWFKCSKPITPLFKYFLTHINSLSFSDIL